VAGLFLGLFFSVLLIIYQGIHEIARLSRDAGTSQDYMVDNDLVHREGGCENGEGFVEIRPNHTTFRKGGESRIANLS